MTMLSNSLCVLMVILIMMMCGTVSGTALRSVVSFLTDYDELNPEDKQQLRHYLACHLPTNTTAECAVCDDETLCAFTKEIQWIGDMVVHVFERYELLSTD